VTGRVIHDEGLSVSPPLELVLLAPADQLDRQAWVMMFEGAYKAACGG